MAEVVSLEGPVEVINGKLAILIPLEAGEAVLAPLAKEIGEIDGEFLKVVIPPWLAEKLRIATGSLVIVDNANGKFTITRSPANDQGTTGSTFGRDAPSAGRTLNIDLLLDR